MDATEIAHVVNGANTVRHAIYEMLLEYPPRLYLGDDEAWLVRFIGEFDFDMVVKGDAIECDGEIPGSTARSGYNFLIPIEDIVRRR